MAGAFTTRSKIVSDRIQTGIGCYVITFSRIQLFSRTHFQYSYRECFTTVKAYSIIQVSTLFAFCVIESFTDMITKATCGPKGSVSIVIFAMTESLTDVLLAGSTVFNQIDDSLDCSGFI